MNIAIRGTASKKAMASTWTVSPTQSGGAFAHRCDRPAGGAYGQRRTGGNYACVFDGVSAGGKVQFCKSRGTMHCVGMLRVASAAALHLHLKRIHATLHMPLQPRIHSCSCPCIFPVSVLCHTNGPAATALCLSSQWPPLPADQCIRGSALRPVHHHCDQGRARARSSTCDQAQESMDRIAFDSSVHRWPCV